MLPTPDEWHWRKGLSLPHVTREICNAWKSDRLIASIVLSSGLGRLAAQLMGWTGSRIAQDAIWWKPPHGTPVSFHTDAPYISHQFEPKQHNSVTFWITLDDVNVNNGNKNYQLTSITRFLCQFVPWKCFKSTRC